jgi:mRNA interferase MazF
MTPFDRGAVLLVTFPFTNLLGGKKRPVIVVSSGEFAERYGDIVVVALTSSSQNDDSLRLEDWQDAGLLKPTWIKPLIGTVALSRVERHLGTLSERDMRRVWDALNAIVPRDYPQ